MRAACTALLFGLLAACTPSIESGGVGGASSAAQTQADGGISQADDLGGACGGQGADPCANGTCQPGFELDSDGLCYTTFGCGAENQAGCGYDQTCLPGLGVGSDGECHGSTPCGGDGQSPCSGAQECHSGTVGDDGLCHSLPGCGAEGEQPCGQGCNPGLGSLNGLCGACGGEGQSPCDDGCLGGYAAEYDLDHYACTACGNEDEPCCASVCNDTSDVCSDDGYCVQSY